MQHIELLAPARNLECGIEAIRHGADAVYIGAPRFGARVAAGNSLEDIAALVQFAHQYGARIYVTLNTLLKDEELEEAVTLAHKLSALKVDALIVQDTRLRTALQGIIPLHASTQMDNRTAEHVAILQCEGYEQAVLARELSLEEIRTIHTAVPEMALEVFVHGALCVCYSGCCYASEYAFGRSANRGECAQFCRLPFDLIDAEGTAIQQQKHLLSLRDMNRSGDLEALMDAGVSSFKIEGRLKDVNYVKNITAYYRQKIDEILLRRKAEFCRSSLGQTSFTFTPNPLKSFNRGFIDYFLHQRGANMVNRFTPKSLGEPLSKDSTPLQNGDGLCYVDAQGELHGLRVNKVDANGQLHTSEPLPPYSQVRQLYRNFDQGFERELSHTTAQRVIPVTWHLTETADGFSLRLAVKGALEEELTTEKTFSYAHDLARSPQRENIVRQLLRLGDTPFGTTPSEIKINFQQEWFLPASVLGEWRREVAAALQTHIIAVTEQHAKKSTATETSGTEPHEAHTGFSGKIPQQLMTCRYCIKHELGYCTKQKKAAPWKEPLSLVLRDGRMFQLHFDCKNCEMHILKPQE